MNKLKLASIVLAAVASTGLVFGSVGFSAVAADRGVSVSVASDEHALVGYESDRIEVEGTETRDLVTVKNRLGTDANVTNAEVSVDSDVATVENVTQPPVPVGQSANVSAEISCKADAEPTVTVSVTVVGEGVTAEIDGETSHRTFTLDCTLPTETNGETDAGDVEFSGNGNVHFDGWSQENLTVTYWTADGKGSGAGSSNTFTEHGPIEADTSKNLKESLGGGGETGFAAVYVEEVNRTYFNDKHTDDGPVADGKQAPTAD
jgi:hypothetical protein